MKTGTLKELNVKPGDVVEWCGSKYIALEEPKPKYANEVWAGTEGNGWIADDAEDCTIISRATDTPTLWRDMTLEEKGALLLAHHEGKGIEFSSSVLGWSVADGPNWFSDVAYRIKPEPKVKVVTLYGHKGKDKRRYKGAWGFQINAFKENTHRITFNTIDGKPDPASIKMEEL